MCAAATQTSGPISYISRDSATSAAAVGTGDKSDNGRTLSFLAGLNPELYQSLSQSLTLLNQGKLFCCLSHCTVCHGLVSASLLSQRPRPVAVPDSATVSVCTETFTNPGSQPAMSETILEAIVHGDEPSGWRSDPWAFAATLR